MTSCSAATGPVIAGARDRFSTTWTAAAALVPLVAGFVLFSGCLVIHPPCELDEQVFYRTLATSPVEHEEGDPSGFLPLSTETPLLVDADSPPPMWDMKLDEAVRLGLENSKVLRDLGGNILRRPDLAQTIHDPALQATDPRFGMDGALAAFDAQLATRLFAYKNDRAFNNLFAGGGTFFFKQDLENYVTELSKTTATGGAFALRHHIDYDANNAPANLFSSYYNVNIEGEFRQPLLQGGGVEFNRIAGPNATPGLVNGVVIARINNDVSTAEFEIGLRDLISNLENGYWDLYYAYRELDSKIAARDTSLKTWRIIHANVEQGRGYSKLQEVQALEQYYRFQEEVIDALGGRVVDRTRTFNGSSGGTFRGIGGVQSAERKLRLWIGLPINDGKLIRPSDAPPEARIVFDWNAVMEEALATRPDLRRQQAKVQRYQAELVANRNFLLPQLDVIGRYRWRGFGHDLIGARNSLDPYNNAFANLTNGQFQEWELGVEYSMPLGFRRGYAAVRNAQVHIARERAILEEQERQAIHDLSSAFADTQRAYTLAHVAYNRLSAAQDQYERAYNAFFNLGGKVSLELVLDARIRLAEAETSYHRARVDYAVAIKNVHFEKGSLMEYNGAMLAGNAFCQGCPEMIAHKHGLGGNEPSLDYVMAKPSAGPAGNVPTAPAPQAAVGLPATDATLPIQRAPAPETAAPHVSYDVPIIERSALPSPPPTEVLPLDAMLAPPTTAQSLAPSTAPISPPTVAPRSIGESSAMPVARSELRLAPGSPPMPKPTAVRLPFVDETYQPPLPSDSESTPGEADESAETAAPEGVTPETDAPVGVLPQTDAP